MFLLFIQFITKQYRYINVIDSKHTILKYVCIRYIHAINISIFIHRTSYIPQLKTFLQRIRSPFFCIPTVLHDVTTMSWFFFFKLDLSLLFHVHVHDNNKPSNCHCFIHDEKSNTYIHLALSWLNLKYSYNITAFFCKLSIRK